MIQRPDSPEEGLRAGEGQLLAMKQPEFPEPGRTPGKAEGTESENPERRASEEPGFTPDQAEGDRETEEINLGE